MFCIGSSRSPQRSFAASLPSRLEETLIVSAPNKKKAHENSLLTECCGSKHHIVHSLWETKAENNKSASGAFTQTHRLASCVHSTRRRESSRKTRG